MGIVASAIKVKFGADTDELNKGVEKARGMADGFKGAFLGAATGLGAFALAGAGITSVKDYFQGAIQGAMDMQVAQAETNRILSSGSHIIGLTGQAVDDLSGKLMAQTGVDDDLIHGAENIIAGYSNISKQAFPDVTKAALDMARAQANATGAQMDANGAAKTLAMALQDPTKAQRLLRSEGILLTEAQQKAIATAMKHGDVQKADGVIMDAVKAKVNGASEAYEKTASGGMMAFQTALGNIQKTIGAALLPMLTNLLNKVLPIALAFASNLPGAIDAAMVAFNNLQPPINFLVVNGDMVKTVLLGLAIGIAAVTAPIIIGLVPAFIAWAVAAGAAAVATIVAAAPVIAIVAGIALLVVGIKLLIDHWSQVTAFLQNVWQNVVTGVQLGLQILGQWFSDLGTKVHDFAIQAAIHIVTFINSAVSFFQNLPGKIWGIVTDFVGGLITRFITLNIRVIAEMVALKDGIVNIIASLPGKLADLIGQAIQAMINKILGMAGNVGKAFSNMFGGIHIPGFASGGISSGGLAMVGENGPELVALPAGARVYNAAQTAGMATTPRSASSGSTQQTISIELDGRVLTSVVVDNMPQHIRLATGNR
jgi:hypothetical protein